MGILSCQSSAIRVYGFNYGIKSKISKEDLLEGYENLKEFF